MTLQLNSTTIAVIALAFTVLNVGLTAVINAAVRWGQKRSDDDTLRDKLKDLKDETGTFKVLRTDVTVLSGRVSTVEKGMRDLELAFDGHSSRLEGRVDEKIDRLVDRFGELNNSVVALIARCDERNKPGGNHHCSNPATTPSTSKPVGERK